MKLSLATPAPRSLPKQQRSRDKYERVLDAAETLIAKEGYEKLTTTGVAQAAGLPPSAFYRWFSDKDDLVSALLMRHNARLDEHIAAAVAELDQAAWTEVARTTFLTVIEYYRRNPSHHILWFEARLGAAARRQVHEHTARLAQALLEQARAGGFAPAGATLEDMKLIIEIADRVTEVAFRDDRNGDPHLLERGLSMVLAIVASFEQPSAA